MRLVPDQPIDAIAFGETGNDLVLVFPDAAEQIVGAPDIERAIKLVRQQIDEEHLAFLPYRRKPVSIGNAGARHQEWTPTFVGVALVLMAAEYAALFRPTRYLH